MADPLADAATATTWAAVDLDALAWNVRILRRQVGPHCRLMAVVKADAYGHGAVEVSRRLRTEGIDWLCVARPEEGIELRQAGLELPVLVLGPSFGEALERCVSAGLTPTLFDVVGLETLERIGAARRQKLAFHLKIDTGMGRLGLQPEAIPAWLQRLGHCSHVRLEGIYSHLAAIESVRGESSQLQIECFRAAVAQVEAAGQSPQLRHLASTSALLDLPEAWLEAVRLGLALYGVYPSHGASRLGLRPIMTLHTRVAVVRDIKAGTSLGYESTFVTRRRSRIAVLPIGYGDGFPKAHSNSGCVTLGGYRAAIVGLVSMDLTLVDVTEIPAVQAGDEVVVFGDEGRGQPLEEFARDAKLSPYEILTGLAARVPRVYREGGRIVATQQRSLSVLTPGCKPVTTPSARS
ncbi:MAG: alanine racemase [Acidobacteriota bacterium]